MSQSLEKILGVTFYFPNGEELEIEGQEVLAADNLNMIVVCRDPENPENGLVKYSGIPFAIRTEPTGLTRADAGDLPRINR